MTHENAKPYRSGSEIPTFPKEGGQEQEGLYTEKPWKGSVMMTVVSYLLAAVSISVSLTAAAVGSWILILAGLYTLASSYILYMASQED